LSVYRALLSVYRALLSVYRALLGVCRALLSVHRALLHSDVYIRYLPRAYVECKRERERERDLNGLLDSCSNALHHTKCK